MSNLGHLGIKPKEQEENAKKLLFGERAGNWLTKAVSSIPDNKVTRSVGSTLDFSQMNPLTKNLAKLEEGIVNRGAQFAQNKLNIDPRVAALGLSAIIPGVVPNEAKAVKNASKLKKLTSNPLLDLEAKNAKAALLQKNKRVPNDSIISTVTSDLKDKAVYGKGNKSIKADIPKELGGKVNTLTQIKGVPNKEFHHVFMKDLSAEYVAKAREFVTQGKATPEDVIMLDRIAKKHGFGLGDYKTAGIYTDRIPHSAAHKQSIKLGIQPAPAGPGPDLGSTKLKIQQSSDIKNLLADFEDSIKEIVIPMRDEIEGFQEAWDRIPSTDRLKLIELRWQRKALRKESKTAVKVKQNPELVKVEEQYSALKRKLQKEMGMIKDNLKEKRLQIKETKADTKQRKLMDRIPEEMWTSKGR